MGYSRLAKKCKECSNTKYCNNKRMESLATLQPMKSEKNLKENNPITINIGRDKIGTSLEEINERIKKDMSIKLTQGAFNIK